ncbi:MAG: NAD(+) synthase [Eubacteriales bacterium]|nr:NAD(+) synthase [Eubacteriales bacterium]
MQINFLYPRQNFGDPELNLELMLSLIDENSDADLILFPPLYLTGVGMGPEALRPEVFTFIEKSLESLREHSLDSAPFALTVPVAPRSKKPGRQSSFTTHSNPELELRLIIFKNGEYFSDQRLKRSLPADEDSLFIFSLLPSYLDSQELLTELATERGANFVLCPAAGDSSSDGAYLGDFYAYLSTAEDSTAVWYSASNSETAEAHCFELPGLDYSDLSFSLIASTADLPARLNLNNPEYPLFPLSEEAWERGLAIPAEGLRRRLELLGKSKVMLGLSGGMDSTLALVLARRALISNQQELEDLKLYYMPGFGSSQRSYNNAQALARGLGLELNEIDIRPACLQHFKDIGQDPNLHDITYENTQARERTQILMDLANRLGGIVLGTGTLSEAALGWCTYNGDQTSMYHVNGGIPKTLVPELLKVEAELLETELADFAAALRLVASTPASPELLPESGGESIDGSGGLGGSESVGGGLGGGEALSSGEKNGLGSELAAESSQITEEVLGPYRLFDYYLWQFRGCQKSPAEFFTELLEADYFPELSPAAKLKFCERFLWRFYSQQFKRRSMPDNPILYPQDLLATGSERLVSDFSAKLFLNNLNSAKAVKKILESQRKAEDKADSKAQAAQAEAKDNQAKGEQ